MREALAAAVAEQLEPVAEPLPHRARFRPQVVLVCGVNGTGKTTTIGKLANQAAGAGLKVRAGGLRHLPGGRGRAAQVWGAAQRRAGDHAARRAPIRPGSPSTRWSRRAAQGADLLLIDTAGRLHNKQALMDELRKIVRVLKKVDPEAPHDTIVLVLDATTGQNAHDQVEIFKAW